MPHVLIDYQKQQHLSACHDLQEQLQNYPTFLSKAITEDNTWVYIYDPRDKATVLSVQKPFISMPKEGQAPSFKCEEHVYHVIYTGKAVPQHTYGGTGGERMYRSYSFTTSVLDGGEWTASRPCHAALYHRGKDPRYPSYRRLGGPQSQSGNRLEEKSLASAGDQTSYHLVVQSVARYCTD
jgi:hypothetical protein